MARYIAITKPEEWSEVRSHVFRKLEQYLQRDNIEHFYVPAEVVRDNERQVCEGRVVLCRAITNQEFNQQFTHATKNRKDMLKKHFNIQMYKQEMMSGRKVRNLSD